MATWPSPTTTYHTEAYPAIDPSLPNLSTAGKNVLITGGGSGIGAEIARAFAKSSASKIALVGRTEETLLSNKQEIEKQYPKTRVSTYVADITDSEALEKAFATEAEKFEPINILVANAGYNSTVASITDSQLDDWYLAFDVNVKGNFNLIRAFIPHAAKDATILNISSGLVQIPFFRGNSAYHASKTAALKLFDYVHGEYPDFFVLNIHPGVIKTAGHEKQVSGGGDVLPTDDIRLPAHFAVWAASPEAKFLNGKFVWAHWDVDELKSMSDQIVGTDKFTLGLLGWP